MRSSFILSLCVCGAIAIPIVGCGTVADHDPDQVDPLSVVLECQSTEDCDDDNECTGETCADGVCEYAVVQDGVCAPPADPFPCTERGIRDAITEGGGPHFFACDGPTTVVTEKEIQIDNDVILDGEGKLRVDGDDTHRVFSVPAGVTAELRGVTVLRGVEIGERGVFDTGAAIRNSGTLALTDSFVVDSAFGRFGYGAVGNDGDMTMTRSTVAWNRHGGIINGGALTLVDSQVTGNTGTAISTYAGTLVLVDTAVWGTDEGGALSAFDGAVTCFNTQIVGSCAIGSGTTNMRSMGDNVESPGDTCGFTDETDVAGVADIWAYLMER